MPVISTRTPCHPTGSPAGSRTKTDSSLTQRIAPQRSSSRAENRRNLGLLLAFVALAITIMVMLLAGVIANPDGLV